MGLSWRTPRAVICLLAVLVVPYFFWDLGEQYGPEVERYAQEVFGVFKVLWIAPAIAVAMIVLAVILLAIYLVLYVTPLTSSIELFRRKVQSLDGYEAFKDAFEEINIAARRNRLIAHGWQEFTETLVRPDNTVPYYRNTVRPQSFINSAHLKSASTGLSIMESLPGYFVGFGLLFTFVGLLAALFFASKSVSSADIAIAQKGLQELLTAATFKFWTSVSGLFCSMLLSFFFRIYDRMIDGACLRLGRTIEDKLLFVSVQDLGNKMEQVLRQQLDETKKINSEVAFTIGKTVSKALETQLPTALASTMQPLVEEVKEASERMGSMGESGVGDMVNRFSEKLQGAAGEEMKQLGNTLSTMQGTLGELGVSIDRITRDFTDSASKSRSDIETTLQEMRETLTTASQRLGTDLSAAASNAASRIEEGATGLVSQLSNEIGGLTESLSQLERTFQEQASTITGAADQSNRAADAFGRVAQDLRSASAPISQSTQQLATAGERITSAVEAASKSFSESQSAMEQLSTEMNESLSKMNDLWDSYRSRFEKVDEDLERAFDQMSDKIRANQDGLIHFVTEIDKHFETALGQLSQTIGSLGDANEDLVESLSKIGTS